MSILELKYNSIKKDIHRLKKEYSNGTGIAGYTIYCAEDTIVNSSATNPALQTEFCGATFYGDSVFVFSSANLNIASNAFMIWTYKMPIAGGDWDVNVNSGSGTEYHSLTSVYVDGATVYFNYKNGANEDYYWRFGMNINGWYAGPTAGVVTTGTVLTTSYVYNGRTYSGNGKSLTSTSKYFIPLVKIE